MKICLKSITAGCAAVASLAVLPAHSEEFTRPPTDGPVPESVAAACTVDKSELIAEIKQRGVLNWALGLAPPFGFRAQDGSYAGIEVDNARELAHFLGVEVNITDYDYNLLPTAVATGQADIIGAELFKTEPRMEVIDYSDTYFMAGQVYYVLEDSEFQTLEDLNSPDNTFVHELGSGQVEMAKVLTPAAEIRLVPKRGQFLTGYDFMKAGEGHSTAYEAHYYPVLKQQYPDLVAIGKNGRIPTPPVQNEDMIHPFEVGFGLRKNEEGWKNCVNAFVHYLLNSAVLEDRIKYWADQLGSTAE